ncbi:DUF4956 domain-containing protein [Candidatus Latescibacterota bacterium]
MPTILTTSLTLNRILVSLTVALVCGLFIGAIYRLSYRGTSYSVSYVQSLVAFTMITTIVIMVIGNNLARAFGLVGSMSIVRFRMAIKDARDIVFIFLALSVGMACGVGQHAVAVVATLYISLIILTLSNVGFAAPHRREYLLNFNYEAGEGEQDRYLSILEKLCKKFKLINIKSVGDTGVTELSYYVTLRKADIAQKLINELGKIEGLSNINFFFDEE